MTNPIGGQQGGNPQTPITTQPRRSQNNNNIQVRKSLEPRGFWMKQPSSINCPSGLEYLAPIDQVFIKELVTLYEAFLVRNVSKRYVIKNSLGQKVYETFEDKDKYSRLLGSYRPFQLRVYDRSHNQRIHFKRPVTCCKDMVEVSAPPGSVIGVIKQVYAFCRPLFHIKNDMGETVLRIRGPLCTGPFCCKDVDFEILSPTGASVGTISRQWPGLARDCFADADYFGIKFPMGLDVRIKACLLGATFLIDFIYYEGRGGIQNQRFIYN